jgi:hypothetical protein
VGRTEGKIDDGGLVGELVGLFDGKLEDGASEVGILVGEKVGRKDGELDVGGLEEEIDGI